MITTDFVPGSPCWIDLGSPDIEASVTFYRKVFGWTADEPAPEMGGYRMLRLDGTPLAGLGPLAQEGRRPAWTVYFATDDVDETARAVVSLGGTVHEGPREVLSLGRIAFCADPQGGDFGLWQARDFPGMGITDQVNSLCWVELWTPDGAGAQSFYAELFDWRYQDFELPDSPEPYRIIAPSGHAEGREFGGMVGVDRAQLAASGGDGDWHPVFAVADCDAAAALVTASGGQVFMGPEDVPRVGRLALCADPFQTGFVLLTPSPE
ncbi:VOC family protein [Nocardiopsis sp. FIRDI 009]|uniref:VOC family protein n=1 Tax=Nocardiopsis sp. FIRDI 009 TaxID=714197 RepID=UPI000E284684|nr:VOC family protein [Nocardiopsis sp. FIRDI 009]